MESLEPAIAAFIRVQRGLADKQELIAIAKDLANGRKEASQLSSSDRLGILDFPNAEQQHENIATATLLSKPELLKRAREAPQDLTAVEVQILKHRYWLDVTHAEAIEQRSAQDVLLRVSPDYATEANNHLERVRSSLYDVDEGQALLDVERERLRRHTAAFKERRQRELEANLPKAQPWVKKLVEAGHAEMPWGFAAFVHPNVGDDEQEMDDFASRRDAALSRAQSAVGCRGPTGSKFCIQHLDWPDAEDEDKRTAEERAESALASGRDQSAEEDAHRFDSEIIKLRERFRALRDDASHKKRKASSQAVANGVNEGILTNVFLLFEKSCVDSFFAGLVDYMWVWAIDPDYQPLSPEPRGASEYKGYLRVRLQQLVNNFFDARRFHEDEYSMKQLWEAAQRSHNKAFVSLNDDQMGLVSLNRQVGSALHLPGTQKLVTGPAP